MPPSVTLTVVDGAFALSPRDRTEQSWADRRPSLREEAREPGDDRRWYEVLREKVFPGLVKDRAVDEPIRIWWRAAPRIDLLIW